jgi:hypothetical protein
MQIFGFAAVVAEHGDAIGERFIIGDDGAGVAVSAEILARIKRKTGGDTQAADLSPPLGRAMGLGRVFDHGNAS